MGKTQRETVSWEDIKSAIQVNPHREKTVEGGASSSIEILPDTAEVTWLPGYSEDTSFVASDAISLALWIRDPMYRSASASIRRVMEMEEASWLLHSTEVAWKTHKQRGWVRKHLEEDLRMRAAGGEPAPDVWDSVRTNRRAAYVVDYICIMRGIRIALWNPSEEVEVTIIPFTSPERKVIQINCVSGHILLGEGFMIDSRAWVDLVSSRNLVAPACAPSIGATTMAQIIERLNELDKDLPTTGNRNVIWNRLLKETVFKELRDVMP